MRRKNQWREWDLTTPTPRVNWVYTDGMICYTIQKIRLDRSIKYKKPESKTKGVTRKERMRVHPIPNTRTRYRKIVKRWDISNIQRSYTTKLSSVVRIITKCHRVALKYTLHIRPQSNIELQNNQNPPCSHKYNKYIYIITPLCSTQLRGPVNLVEYTTHILTKCIQTTTWSSTTSFKPKFQKKHEELYLAWIDSR